VMGLMGFLWGSIWVNMGIHSNSSKLIETHPHSAQRLGRRRCPLITAKNKFVVRRAAYLASIKSLGWMGHTKGISHSAQRLRGRRCPLITTNYSAQMRARLIIVFIARFIVVSDAYSYLPWKFIPPVKILGQGRPINERREPSVPPRIGFT